MDLEVLDSHRLQNRLQSVVLLVTMGLLLGYIGWLLLGLPGSAAALLMVLISYLFNSQLSPRFVLRMHRAQPLSPLQAPGLYQALEELGRRAELPARPRLYYVGDEAPNAFAIGSSADAAIVLSLGLLRRMDGLPLLGVLGHEIAHIRNHDLQLMNFADLIGRMTGIFAFTGLVLVLLSLPLVLMTDLTLNWHALVWLLLAPQACLLLQLALSRTREFEADRGSAELIGSPEPLIRALDLLDPPPGFWQRLWLPARRPALPSEIRSHPSTRERIQRLAALRIPAGRQPPMLAPQLYRPSELPPHRPVWGRYWRP